MSMGKDDTTARHYKDGTEGSSELAEDRVEVAKFNQYSESDGRRFQCSDTFDLQTRVDGLDKERRRW